MSAILSFIDRQSKATLWAIASFILLLLGSIDFYSGFELSFAIFYLIPVALLAWGVSRSSGFVLSIASAAIWLTANRLAGDQLSHPALPYWNALTRLGFFWVVSALLAEVKRLLESERRLARMDPLTGALNRRAFDDIAALEILRVKRYRRPLSLLYIDLDNFKIVNDQMGHAVGDTLLSTVVTSLTANLRETDRLARLGGDEFAVLLPETDRASAQRLVPRLQEALLEQMAQHQWPVTFSIGALICQQPPHSIAELLQASDQLMYTVKKSGKNAIAYSEIAATPPA
ncbi:MAG: GGDEF domain-containing protein [Cyanobacteria bacterium P01_A01_bin.17]